ncbi:hypothetical protein HGRIS_003221 [Hohenbuehelia grisea]|uniref:P-loop containing nucleoside triphosphate hydrolase protein n=1 Tax=Hohenbuehelia grisea TaxID=104357 RepID=A0ABR3JNE1_9AGAR
MDTLKSLVQPILGGAGSSSMVDGMKLVVLGGTVETARRVSSSAWSHFVNSFFLTAHFSEEDYPYDWLMLWLSRRPEWQRSREFETTTRTTTPGTISKDDHEDEQDENGSDWVPGKAKTRVVFQPTFDSTHTIYYKGHWLRVKRSHKTDGSGSEVLSISVVARNNTILKSLVLEAKRAYEAESIHRIQIYFADSYGSWRWTDSRHKRPLTSIVLEPGVKEMLVDDTKDFLRSEAWYADRGIPFRRGYLLHGVPGSGKSSLIHALAGELQLDVYVISLSSSWISDSMLQTLMGRVPARCILLLEDLDAAFTRSTSRDEESTGSPETRTSTVAPAPISSSSRRGGRSSRRTRSARTDQDKLNDVNTLSLSGLLNALDGVAAAEGRILFATTNHLERLDPALSRPGRMDVWVEFKNASKWQAEALFRHFFPCTEGPAPWQGATEADAPLPGDDAHCAISDDRPPKVELDEDDEELNAIILGDIEVCTLGEAPRSGEAASQALQEPSSPTSSSASSLWTTLTRTSSWISTASPPLNLAPSLPSSPSSPATNAQQSPTNASDQTPASGQFGASNTSYIAPPVDEAIAKARHSARPLDPPSLARLAKQFADAIPEGEFSVAALQGYLLKHKSQPDAAAEGAAAWAVSEREMRERLRKEKEAREQKAKLERERRKKEAARKEAEKTELEKKQLELDKVKQELEAAKGQTGTTNETATAIASQPKDATVTDAKEDSDNGEKVEKENTSDDDSSDEDEDSEDGDAINGWD